MNDSCTSLAVTEDFEDEISSTLARANKTDQRLVKAQKRVQEALAKSDKVIALIDSEKAASLTLEECEVLVEYLLAENDVILNQYRICYLKGLRDGIAVNKIVD